jgi:hypothetical protein
MTIRSLTKAGLVCGVLPFLGACGAVDTVGPITNGAAIQQNKNERFTLAPTANCTVIKKAAIIGGVGYPLTSWVNAGIPGLRARCYEVTYGGPGYWPHLEQYAFIGSHSTGAVIASTASAGPRDIYMIDAFMGSVLSCPKGASVTNIFNPFDISLGPVPCAHNIAHLGIPIIQHIALSATAWDEIFADLDAKTKVRATQPAAVPTAAPPTGAPMVYMLTGARLS